MSDPGYSQTFEAIYVSNYWGSPESRSGDGSELGVMRGVIPELEDMLARYDIDSVLDAPCGDFNWMQEVDLEGIDYVGMDIVEAAVRENNRRYGQPSVKFLQGDIIRDDLPAAELVICRDALIHLSNQHARQAINNFRRSGASYLLVTLSKDIQSNEDIETGEYRRINLQLPPFDFPPPLEEIDDNGPGYPGDKTLALWETDRLPEFEV